MKDKYPGFSAACSTPDDRRAEQAQDGDENAVTCACSSGGRPSSRRRRCARCSAKGSTSSASSRSRTSRRAARAATLVPPPVKLVAIEEDLPVLQPERPRGEEFSQQLRELAPDISVVVAYGHILPKEVIDLPPTRDAQHSRVAAAALARRGADPGGDPRRATRRPASRSCGWCRRSTPGR